MTLDTIHHDYKQSPGFYYMDKASQNPESKLTKMQVDTRASRTCLADNFGLFRNSTEKSANAITLFAKLNR